MQITIYSTPTCPYCKMAKEFLTEHKIAFTNKDVSTDQAAMQEMIDKTNQLGVPVIEVDGEILIGFDKKKLAKLAKIEG